MNKKNISPNSTEPVDRLPTGQLPGILTELSEESLAQNGSSVLPSSGYGGMTGLPCYCSFDGDNE